VAFTETAIYTIPPSVRVRKEAFGLLFYHTDDSRLTFVKSKDMLQIQTLTDGTKHITTGLEPKNQANLKTLLDHLLKKRLICGA
jgi:putative mycofactocin binding protein MftB